MAIGNVPWPQMCRAGARRRRCREMSPVVAGNARQIRHDRLHKARRRARPRSGAAAGAAAAGTPGAAGAAWNQDHRTGCFSQFDQVGTETNGAPRARNKNGSGPRPGMKKFETRARHEDDETIPAPGDRSFRNGPGSAEPWPMLASFQEFFSLFLFAEQWNDQVWPGFGDGFRAGTAAASVDDVGPAGDVRPGASQRGFPRSTASIRTLMVVAGLGPHGGCSSASFSSGWGWC